jgi:2-keto-4-pentenoate hydratase/2-oxohepta-3-ene-1,7-dioic acid hydratase in catechol pathway
VKLVTYATNESRRLGAVVEDRVIDLEPVLSKLPRSLPAHERLTGGSGSMIDFLNVGAPAVEAAVSYLDDIRRNWNPASHLLLADAKLLAPVPRPGKIVAIGRNYADHATETGVKPFEKPRIIAKLPSSVTGPGSIVQRPAGVTKLDYEVELAVVIGRIAKVVSREDALSVVAGYTVLNDLSAREFQFDVTPPQTTFAKSMDGFCPMGPWLVTRDEIPGPQALTLKCWVNGELVQEGHTREMLFSVAHIIEYITNFITLEPGDVIATGTPAGIGAFRKPPRWLQPGDRLKLEVSQIGRLEHSIG